MSRRLVRIGRMNQFPSQVRVKFIHDKIWVNAFVSVSSQYISTQINMVPVEPVLSVASWKDTGDPGINSTYPDGWITWQNAYERYKVLAARVDVYALPQNQGTRRQGVIGLIPKASDSISLGGTPRNWILDPRCKWTSLDMEDGGRVALNMPTLSMYLKPRDLWRNNIDWGTTEATMTAQPGRYMAAYVFIMKTNQPSTGQDLDYQIRVRWTLYTELFDRKRVLDDALLSTAPTTTNNLQAALASGGGPGLIDAAVIDSKMSS